MNPLRLFRLIGAGKRRDIEFFPPWRLLGIRLVENRDNWRHVRIRLPLGYFTRNLGGHMFGSCQANLADPIVAIACAHIFPDYSVWARARSIDFREIGGSDLELRFDFDPALEARICEELREGAQHAGIRVRFLPGRRRALHPCHQHRGHPAEGQSRAKRCVHAARKTGVSSHQRPRCRVGRSNSSWLCYPAG